MILYEEYLKILEPNNFKKLNLAELKEDSFYFGDCRNADLALWKNNKFYYIREKFGFKDNESYLDSHKRLFISKGLNLMKKS